MKLHTVTLIIAIVGVLLGAATLRPAEAETGALFTFETWEDGNGGRYTKRTPTAFALPGTPTIYNFDWDGPAATPCSTLDFEMEFNRVGFTPSKIEVDISCDGAAVVDGDELCYDCGCPSNCFGCDKRNNFTRWSLPANGGWEFGAFTNWPTETVEHSGGGAGCPISPYLESQSTHGSLVHTTDLAYDVYEYDHAGTPTAETGGSAVVIWQATAQKETWDWYCEGTVDDPNEITTFSTTDSTYLTEVEGTGDFVMEWGVGFDIEPTFTTCAHQYALHVLNGTADAVKQAEAHYEVRIYP